MTERMKNALTGPLENDTTPGELGRIMFDTLSPEQRVSRAQELLAGIDPRAAAGLRSRLRNMLAQVEMNGSTTDPCDLNWRTMLENPGDKARFDYWHKVYKYWKADPKHGEAGLRNLMNTFSAPYESLKETLNTLRLESFLIIVTLLEDLLPGNKHNELKEKMFPHATVLRASDIEGLLRLVYEGKDINDGKSGELVRYESFRTIALMLLCRAISQDPQLRNLSEDSTYFEDFLLRDLIGLIEGDDYEEVTVWFRPNVREGEPADVMFTQPESGEWESTKLYKTKMSGRLYPYSDERGEVEVFCFPGNKCEKDSKEVGSLSERERRALRKQKTIIDYKDHPKIALKNLRKDTVLDCMRMTALVKSPKDFEVLNAILQTNLGSGVGRKKWGKSDNPASTKTYNDFKMTQTVESIHNEAKKRNFYIEVRTGVLSRGILDRSKKQHPASHLVYGVNRSLPIARLLFPRELYPEFAELIDSIEQDLKLQRK